MSRESGTRELYFESLNRNNRAIQNKAKYKVIKTCLKCKNAIEVEEIGTPYTFNPWCKCETENLKNRNQE